MPTCMFDALELLLLIVYYCHVPVSAKGKFLKLMVLPFFARHAVLCVDYFCLHAAAEQDQISPATKLFADQGR